METIVQVEETLPPEEEQAAADAPQNEQAGEQEEVSAADLLYGEQQQEDGNGQTVPDEENTQADAAPGRTYTKREFDQAVRRKIDLASRDMRKRLMDDPFYRMGRQLAQAQAVQTGADPHLTALQMLQGRADTQIPADTSLLGRASGPIPGQVPILESAQEQIGEQAPGQTPFPAEAGPSESPSGARAQGRTAALAQNIAREMAACKSEGLLPEGFSVQACATAFPSFISDCAQYGVRTALHALRAAGGLNQTGLRMPSAPSAPPAALSPSAVRNAALPPAIRPAYNAPSSGEVDYNSLSSAEFNRMKERMRKEYLNGKRVRL